MGRRITLVVLGIVAAVLVLGAIASATSHDKMQGDVQTLIVNDTGVTLKLGICHNWSCTETDPVSVLKPGDIYDQADGPNDTQRFAVLVEPADVVRSSPVPGKSYRCTQFTSGALVAARYPISTFTPC